MIQIVPLHSLVLIVGPDAFVREDVASIFDSHEVISIERLARDIFGNDRVQDVAQNLFPEMMRRAQVSLRHGRRAVINDPFFNREDRLEFVQIARLTGVPIYYLVCGERGGRRPAKTPPAEKAALSGDNGLAISIDTRETQLFVVPNRKPTIEQLAMRFSGLTVIPDLHGMLPTLEDAVAWARARQHYIMFLGDVVDYGHQSLAVADRVHQICSAGEGELLLGNHERKIYRYINQGSQGGLRLSEGNKVTTHALGRLKREQRDAWENRFRATVSSASVSRTLGSFTFAHAAVPRGFWTGEATQRDLERLCLFGEYSAVDSRTYEWAKFVPNNHTVMVGHDVRCEIQPFKSVNEEGGKVFFMDTGCGKGGKLTSADLKFRGNDLVIANFNVH